MADINCESVMLAAMALIDGERPSLSTFELEDHLSWCELCKEEVDALRELHQVFNSRKRVHQQVAVWPTISQRLDSGAAKTQFSWRLVLLFGVPLLGYKGLMLILQIAPSLWLKFIPVILVILVFAVLRTNPFKINSELTLSGELSS